MALTTGSGTFTNGSVTVSGVTFSSGGASFISSGTLLGVGVSPMDRQVEAVSATTNTITLREPWAGTTGTKQFTAAYTTEGLRDAVESARGFSEQLASRSTASTTDMQVATDDVKISTPLKVKQAIYFHTGTAATRDVGESNGEVPDKAVLDTRLATTGNLGAAATRDVGVSAGNLMEVGAFGLGGSAPASGGDTNDLPNGFAYASGINNPSSNAAVITATANNRYGFQLSGRGIIGARLRTVEAGVWTPWRVLYHTGNTTVDSNGFVKAASPIIRVYSDGMREVLQSQGAEYEKVGVGHYLIKNTLGFAKEGWYIETPKDANGSVLFITEFSQLENNDIEIKTYTPTGQGWKPEKGEPVDISEGRWIDIRLHEEKAEEIQN